MVCERFVKVYLYNIQKVEYPLGIFIYIYIMAYVEMKYK